MAEWSDFYGRSQSAAATLANLAVHMPMFLEIVRGDSPRVIEVGVGTGDMSRFLAFLGCTVVGVDNDPEVLARVVEKSAGQSGLEYRLEEAFTLGEVFPSGAFDVAFSQGFFEHFSDEQIRSLCSQQLAVAHRVVFSVPSRWYPNQDFGDERLLGADTWEEILRPVGRVSARYYDELPVKFWMRQLRRVLRLPHPGRHVLVLVDAMT